MKKIGSPEELNTLRERLSATYETPAGQNAANQPIRVKIAMATCGIASGAREVMETFREEFKKRNMLAEVIQTGCMGYCYAEPTVEITLPGSEPLTFGFVDTKKASRIIDHYILGNELVDGIIPVNYDTIYNR